MSTPGDIMVTIRPKSGVKCVYSFPEDVPESLAVSEAMTRPGITSNTV